MKEAFDLFQEIFKGYQLHNFAIWLYVARYMIRTDKERALKDNDNNNRFSNIEKDVSRNTTNIERIDKKVTGLDKAFISLEDKFRSEKHAEG